MRIIKIPKKTKGEFRTIYIPNKKEKKECRTSLSFLKNSFKNAKKEFSRSCHGFREDRNIITNAISHVGYEYTTCFDLQDFFDSITKYHFKEHHYYATFLLVDGVARQGLPSSPWLSNVATTTLDNNILEWIGSEDMVYTRYADDLSFSYNNPEFHSYLIDIIPRIVEEQRFRINPKKTHRMSAKNGRRIITGIAVGRNNIYPTRKTKRKLRAARHQNNEPSARGLEEFCLLKLPKNIDKGIKAQVSLLRIKATSHEGKKDIAKRFTKFTSRNLARKLSFTDVK